MADMDDLKENVEEMLEDLKQQYGELRVQANLAGKEARDELQVLGQKLIKLEGKARELGGATREASKDVGAAAKLLGEEIRDGLKSIAKHF